MKKFLYSMSLINIILGVLLFLLGNKYAYVESVMERWLYVFVIGIIMFYFILKMKDSKSKLKKICIFYPIVLIVSGIMIFSSIPNYSYKEAIFIIEEHTGEKTIESKELKSTEGLYYIYTQNEVYLFDPWNGQFATIPKIK